MNPPHSLSFYPNSPARQTRPLSPPPLGPSTQPYTHYCPPPTQNPGEGSGPASCNFVIGHTIAQVVPSWSDEGVTKNVAVPQARCHNNLPLFFHPSPTFSVYIRWIVKSRLFNSSQLTDALFPLAPRRSAPSRGFSHGKHSPNQTSGRCAKQTSPGPP